MSGIYHNHSKSFLCQLKRPKPFIEWCQQAQPIRKQKTLHFSEQCNIWECEIVDDQSDDHPSEPKRVPPNNFHLRSIPITYSKSNRILTVAWSFSRSATSWARNFDPTETKPSFPFLPETAEPFLLGNSNALNWAALFAEKSAFMNGLRLSWNSFTCKKATR